MRVLGLKGFFNKQYKKVFKSTRLTFAERFYLALPAIPLSLAGVMTFTIMFKYFTDVVGLNPAMVGSVFMLLSIWNGINDPLIGLLLDKMPYIKNKGKYLYVSKIAIPLITAPMILLLFVQGSWPDKLIYAYMLGMYIIYETGITAFASATGSYRFIRLKDSEERVECSMISTYLIFIFSAVVTLIPQIMFVGDKPSEYITPIMVIILTLNAGLFWFSIARLKDSEDFYLTDYVNEDAQLAKDIVRYVKDIIKLRGFWVTNIIGYFIGMSVAYYFTFYLYYMDDILNATSTQSIIIDLSTGIIAFLIMPIVPSICRKIGAKRSTVLVLIPGLMGFVLLYFTNSIPMVLISFTLIVICNASYTVVASPLGSLITDDDWQKTGERKVAFIGALSGLVSKPANGLRALIFGGVLAFYGYDGTAAVQSDRALEGLRVASSVVPFIMVLCAIFVMIFYPYNLKKEKEIVAKREIMEAEHFERLHGKKVTE